MNCKSFSELNILEKVNFIGKLCHAAQSDDNFFNDAKIIIEKAEQQGMFERVKFTHDTGAVQGIVNNYLNETQK